MSFAGMAWAEADVSSSKVKIEDVNGSSNKAPGEDVDETITNNKMRAELGSKSKYSLATAFTYNGGSVDRPLAARRPNIQDVTGTMPVADLNGTINGKYSITQKDSILVGGGLRWVTPIQGSRPAGYSGQMFDVYDPSINYQHVYKAFGMQSYYQVGPTFYTRTNLVDEGYIANVAIYNVNSYDIGTTGLSVGLQSGATLGFYKPAFATEDMTEDEMKNDQSDYSFFLYPQMEYQITDKINLRTVSFLMSYEHTRLLAADTWRHSKVIQSFGVGFSVTRDVFLYPNIQFIPDDIRADATNVGLSANLNIF